MIYSVISNRDARHISQTSVSANIPLVDLPRAVDIVPSGRGFGCLQSGPHPDNTPVAFALRNSCVARSSNTDRLCHQAAENEALL